MLRGSSRLKGVIRIAAGTSHTCAVRIDGTVWCWGDASFGQLGNGQSGAGTFRTKAVQVRRGNGHLTGVEHIASSGHHTCALRTNGTVWCWGNDLYGQLGDGTTGDGAHLRTSAVRVRRGGGSLDEVMAIATGHFHSCALVRDGSVWCWGDGSLGQLGDGEEGANHLRTRASRVRRGTGYLGHVSGIAAGGSHACVRRTDGTAWCWGYGSFGQLGDGTTNIRSKPVQVLRGSGVLTRVAGIAAGGAHTCARRSDGSARCWGSAGSGQVGDGTTGDPVDHLRLKPVRVIRPSGAFTNVRKVALGNSHTCALRTDKTVWCWGSNFYGQLARGSDVASRAYPGKVVFP